MENDVRSDDMRGVALLCLGVGLGDAWWLSVSIGSGLAGVPESGWESSFAMHVAYLLMQVLCFFAFASIARALDEPPTVVWTGAFASLCTGANALAYGSGLIDSPFVGLALLIGAAAANAMVFLTWLRVYSFMAQHQRPVPLILATMASGGILWLVISQIPAPISDAVVSLLPVCSALPLAAVAKSETSAHAAIADDRGNAPVDAQDQTANSRHRNWPLAPLFIAGIFAYELAPGLVTGMVHFNDLTVTYAIYAAGMLGITCLAFAFDRSERFTHALDRFIVPLLSLGLFAFALLSIEESTFAAAATILGSMLFEAFLFARFAEISAEREEEPLRVFALGGIAVQLGLLCSYALAPVLAVSTRTALTAAALLIVFILLLGGSFAGGGIPFFKRSDDGDANGSKHATEKPAIEVFREMCSAFAAELGLSKREADVFELAMQGKNLSVIAEELFIASSTVKTHLRSIYRKAGVADRQELIRLFREFEERN